MTISRRFNTLEKSHVFILGALVLVPVLMAFTLSPAMSGNPEFEGNKGINSSQVLDTINSDIAIVNYTAPNFTWIGPVIFNFTIDSNVSTTIDITIFSDAFDAEQTNFTIAAPGMYNIIIIKAPALLATPGYKQVSFTFTVGVDNASIVHNIWLGSTMMIALIFIVGILLGCTGLIIKFKEPGSASGISSSSSGPMSTPATSGDGFPAMGEDDTSTMTYVDQSRAPPGQIYCPECKKLIEEGSIFCPECGTRIPRYLRYRPDQ